MNKHEEQFYKDKIASLEALLSAYKVILEGKEVQIKILQEYIKKGIDVLWKLKLL